MRKLANLVCAVLALRRIRLLDIVLSILLALVVGTIATELVNFLISIYPQSVPAGLQKANDILRNVALALTSVLFACAHVDLLHAIAVFPLGVLFGILRKRTGSIWPAMIAHAANNTMASLTLIF